MRRTANPEGSPQEVVPDTAVTDDRQVEFALFEPRDFNVLSGRICMKRHVVRSAHFSHVLGFKAMERGPGWSIARRRGSLWSEANR